MSGKTVSWHDSTGDGIKRRCEAPDNCPYGNVVYLTHAQANENNRKVDEEKAAKEAGGGSFGNVSKKRTVRRKKYIDANEGRFFHEQQAKKLAGEKVVGGGIAQGNHQDIINHHKNMAAVYSVSEDISEIRITKPKKVIGRKEQKKDFNLEYKNSKTGEWKVVANGQDANPRLFALAAKSGARSLAHKKEGYPASLEEMRRYDRGEISAYRHNTSEEGFDGYPETPPASSKGLPKPPVDPAVGKSFHEQQAKKLADEKPVGSGIAIANHHDMIKHHKNMAAVYSLDDNVTAIRLTQPKKVIGRKKEPKDFNLEQRNSKTDKWESVGNGETANPRLFALAAGKGGENLKGVKEGKPVDIDEMRVYDRGDFSLYKHNTSGEGFDQVPAKASDASAN